MTQTDAGSSFNKVSYSDIPLSKESQNMKASKEMLSLLLFVGVEICLLTKPQ